VAGETAAAGDLCYEKSDGKAWLAKATDDTKIPVRMIATAAVNAGATGTFGVFGLYRNDSRYNFTLGATAGLVYIGVTGGTETQTQPASTGNIVQIVGTAKTADILFFDPQLDYITHT
jgi:hypothetical protein